MLPARRRRWLGALVAAALAPASAGAGTWSDRIAITGIGRGDAIVSVAPMDEDGDGAPDWLAIGGVNNDPMAGYDNGWLGRVGLDGDLIWLRQWGDVFMDVEDAGGGAIVALVRATLTDGTPQTRLVRVGPDGTQQWSVAFSGLGGDVAWSLCRTTDDQWIATGVLTRSATIPQSDGFVVRVAADGTVLWQKAYGSTDSSRHDELHAVAPAPGGGAYVGGWWIGAAYDAWIMRLDPGGGIAWQRSIGTADYEDVLDLAPMPDGGVLAALSLGPTYDDHRLALVRLDSAGDLVWQFRYDAAVGQTPVALVARRTGGWLVGGRLRRSGGFIMAAEADGSVAWNADVSPTLTNPCSVQDVVDLPGGDVVIAGSRRDVDGYEDGWLARHDALARLGPSCPPILGGMLTTVSPAGFSIAAAPLASRTHARSVSVPSDALVPVALDEVATCPPACSPPSARISVPAGRICASEDLAVAGTSAGEGALVQEWDLDYDGASFDVDAAGGSIVHAFPEGPVTIAFRVTDSCASPGPATAVATAVLDVVDCSPAPPGEVRGLRASCEGGVVRLRWDPEPAADSYDVLAGVIASLAAGRYDHGALACETPALAADGGACTDGVGAYFLVAARNVAGRGSLGSSSLGSLRPAAAPDCP